MKDRLVFEKTSCEIVDGSTSCDRCDLAKLFPGTGNCKVFGCKTNENYKLIVGEKKPVPTEYEWKKERLETIKQCGKKFILEIAPLVQWLQKNKPQNWQPCTGKNTKVGDTVRSKQNKTKQRNCHY